MSALTAMRRMVTAAVAMCLVLTVASTAGATGTDANYQPLPAAVVHDLAVRAPTLDAVAAGHANMPPRLANDKKITQGGKPEVAYVLGEFCPYCAAESWALAVALKRFGSFSGLTTLTSSAVDSPPSLQTISFRYSHYTSRYVAFVPVVNEDTNFKKVEPVPKNVLPAWSRYHSYPFVDFGGRALLTVTSFSANLLKGLSRESIAGDLAHAARPVARAIDGSANQLTAAVCLATGNKPTTVCDSKTIATIEKSLH